VHATVHAHNIRLAFINLTIP